VTYYDGALEIDGKIPVPDAAASAGSEKKCNKGSFTAQYLDACSTFKDAVLSILAKIAMQGRIRLSERTIAGLEKARREGRIGGRPAVVVDRDRLARLDEEGWTTREIGEGMGIHGNRIQAAEKLSAPAESRSGALTGSDRAAANRRDIYQFLDGFHGSRRAR
jgi:hypothetical protein